MELEILEQRLTPAITTLLGGTLAIVGDNHNDVIDVYLSNQTNQIIANVNGINRSFDPATVQRIVLDGQGGNDVLTSQVNTVPDVLFGGNGNDVLQAFGVTSVVLGGSGQDNIYAIVGTGAYLDGGSGRDRIIGNATSIINNDAADRPNVIFGVATQPVQLINGVVYFLGTANADSAQITEQQGKLFVVYNGSAFTFNKSDVNTFAGVFGAGDDSAINRSSIDSVFYGAGGNDTLIGGSGNDLLKGGSGNDLLMGNDGHDDLTGDPGVDTVMGGNNADVLRVDAADVFNPSNQDLVILRAQQR